MNNGVGGCCEGDGKSTDGSKTGLLHLCINNFIAKIQKAQKGENNNRSKASMARTPMSLLRKVPSYVECMSHSFAQVVNP